ncbi:MAG: hypothetical protein ACM3VT_18870 [Solirubrobacterales bacterium]
MTCTTAYTPRTTPATTLKDFVIQGAAELGECHGAQSFRAVRRRDGRSVLLHKFRPSATLTSLGPLVGEREPPDFRTPFVTRFSDLFAVAGSAYLVEPLPSCSCLSDVWRHVLQKRPAEAVTVMAAMIHQTIAITHRLLHTGSSHGALDVRNIILAPAGCFGLLASHVDCERGSLWLREAPDRPPQLDLHGLVGTLVSLMDLDMEVAGAQNTTLRVPANIHRRIRSLSYALERSQRAMARSA